MKVLRLWVFVPPKRWGFIGTILRWLSFNIPATLVALLSGKHDAVLTLSPPFSLGLSAWLYSILYGVPFIYNAQDIYPDVVIQQGILNKEGLLADFIKSANQFIYRKAAKVTVLSEGFKDNLINKGVPSEKIEVIPNAVDTVFFQPGERKNSFAVDFGLKDQFVVMYLGNVGGSFPSETLLRTIRSFQSEKHIRFVIGGRGTALPDLKEQCRQENLSNVLFLSYLPKEELPRAYASSDLQLVLQKKGLSEHSIPMKVKVIMACGRPLLVSADLEGEASQLVDQAACGFMVPPEDSEALVSQILKAAEKPDDLKEMGKNARAYAEAHFSPRSAAEAYQRIFREVVRSEHQEKV